jgi:hypothetical protein
MQRTIFGFLTKFLEGAAISVAMYLAGWITIVSASAAWRFLGHVAGNIALHWIFGY